MTRARTLLAAAAVTGALSMDMSFAQHPRASAPPASIPVPAQYVDHCAICHDEGPMHPGWLALKDRGLAEPDLSKRGDLEEDYVRAVVRNGVGRMPALTPTSVPDRDLDAITTFLGAHR